MAWYMQQEMTFVDPTAMLLAAADEWVDRSITVRRAMRAWLERQSTIYSETAVAQRYAVLRMITAHFAWHRGSMSAERLQNLVERRDPYLYRRAVGRRWRRFVEEAEEVLGLVATYPAWAGGEPVWRIHLACRDATVWSDVDARNSKTWEERFHRLGDSGMLDSVIVSSSNTQRPTPNVLELRMPEVCQAIQSMLRDSGCADPPSLTTVRRQVLRAIRDDPDHFGLTPLQRTWCLRIRSSEPATATEA